MLLKFSFPFPLNIYIIYFFKSVNKMISCKTDCDFSDWITDNSSIAEIRTLISNFFPYLSSSSKQV